MYVVAKLFSSELPYSRRLLFNIFISMFSCTKIYATPNSTEITYMIDKNMHT